jgi:NAD(P)-dependent dehydrogenase (short-subunit alcohol dehydrogenase family)
MAYEGLRGKVALVTGSSSGMGRASAVLLAKQGVHVVCCDLRPEANPAGFEDDLHFTTVQMVEKQGSSAFFVKVDISNAAEVEEAFKETISVSASLPFPSPSLYVTVP